MTEQEIQEVNLIPVGIYPFEVLSVDDTDNEGYQLKSKAGNAMIKLQLKIWDANGRAKVVYDYLVSVESMVYKIKHFCDSIGFENEYAEGKFNPKSCIGKSGSLDLSIQKGKLKPGTRDEFYSDKNSVKDYLKSGMNAANKSASSKQEEPPFFDDDIPFN